MTVKNNGVRPDHGARTKAGQLLSAYLRQIAEEVTETVKDPESGEERLATKAEALARKIWRDALGYTETKVVKNERIEIEHIPSRAAQSMIYDRVEGRAPASMGDDKGGVTAADKVTEQATKRIAKAGGIDATNN